MRKCAPQRTLGASFSGGPMRLTATLALCIFMAGCAGFVQQGPAPSPGPIADYRAVFEGDLSASFTSTFGGVNVTAPIRVHGNGTATFVAPPGRLYLDGAGDLIVEPLPGREVEAADMVRSGRLVIRRAGVHGLLNPPGSAAAAVRAASASFPPAAPAAK